MVDFFIPVINSKPDFETFIQVATSNGYSHITKPLDINSVTIKHALHFITLVEGLGRQDVNSNEYPDIFLYHIHLGFFFKMNFELTAKIAGRTDLKIISFDSGSDKDVGIITGTLAEWKISVVEALSGWSKFDEVYTKLFSGILKSLDVLNYSKIFQNFTRIEKDGIIILRDK